MAELYGPWQRALDDNVQPYAGAKLYTFDAVATTTPKTTYADPDLTEPHPNPVVADAYGNFPQIFAEAGNSYYLSLRTAAGVVIEDYEAVDALGELGLGAFTRDFGLNGRWRVRGAGGEIYTEYGDPDGDDVGGRAVISGWEGTQLDSLDIRSADTTFDGPVEFAGAVTFSEQVAGIDGRASSGTADAVTELVIPLPTGYDALTLHLRKLRGSATAANTQLKATFSFDGGGTYLTGASDYNGVTTQISNTAGVTGTTASAAAMNLGTIYDPDGERFARLEVEIIATASGYAGLSGTAWTSQGKALIYQGTNVTQTAVPTHIRIAFASGTLSCQWELTGILNPT